MLKCNTLVANFGPTGQRWPVLPILTYTEVLQTGRHSPVPGRMENLTFDSRKTGWLLFYVFKLLLTSYLTGTQCWLCTSSHALLNIQDTFWEVCHLAISLLCKRVHLCTPGLYGLLHTQAIWYTTIITAVSRSFIVQDVITQHVTASISTWKLIESPNNPMLWVLLFFLICRSGERGTKEKVNWPRSQVVS